MRENKAVRSFLDAKKNDGVLKKNDGVLKIRVSRSDDKTPFPEYMQSVLFENRTYGFVIAVIYELEFQEVFGKLKAQMSAVANKEAR